MPPMTRFVLLALGALLAIPAGAAAAADRPQVYVIVIDGLDGDRVDSGSAPFVKSLIDGKEGASATYFAESRSTMIAETNPNHTSMATGAYGGSSGIPGNSFAVYGQPPNDDGCATTGLDESKPPVVTSGEDPSCVSAETLFQTVDRQQGSLTTAGIFGKPKLARLFSAKRPDGRYYADNLWAPCEGSDDPTPYCRQVTTNPATGYALEDSIVMDEVIREAREQPADYTFVNLPEVDSVGHGSGTGASYDAAIGMADDQIRRFVDAQRQLGRWGKNTVLLLVSDHSMESTPEKTSLDQRFRTAGVPSDAYKIVQNGSASLVYLSNRRDPGRFDLLKRMRAAALGTGNPASELTGNGPVSEALYREANPADGGNANTLDTVHPAWSLAGPRAGDLVVTHRAGGAFSDPANPLPGNHGGPQTRDNFMAVIGPASMVQQARPPGEARPGFDDTTQNPQQSENVDVAPTVARLLGIGASRASQGRILGEALQRTGLPPVRLPVLGLTPSPKRVRAGRRVLLTFSTGVGGAKVRLGNKRVTSNSAGRARMRVTLHKAGLRKVVASKKGYRSTTRRIRVLPR